MYKIVGEQLIDMLSQHSLRPAQLRDIYAKLSNHGPMQDMDAVNSGSDHQNGSQHVYAEADDTSTTSSQGHDQQSQTSAAAVKASHKQSGVIAQEDTMAWADVSKSTAAASRRGGYKVRALAHCGRMQLSATLITA